jgi:hypothetical protein
VTALGFSGGVAGGAGLRFGGVASAMIAPGFFIGVERTSNWRKGYRFDPAQDTVFVLAVRSQRERDNKRVV